VLLSEIQASSRTQAVSPVRKTLDGALFLPPQCPLAPSSLRQIQTKL
jgi:hypothetical protein